MQANRRAWLLGAALVCVAGPGAAQNPYLVRDIDQRPGPSDAGRFTDLGSLAVFDAVRPDVGRELFRTDGTGAGTFLAADICPGPCSAFPTYLFGHEVRLQATVAAGKAYFPADDGTSGTEPWVSDGTQAFALGDLEPGRGASVSPDRPLEGAALGGDFYFVAGTGGLLQLWRTDGTPGSAQPVFATDPPQIEQIAEMGGSLWFIASGPAGDGLYRSNGTAVGTTLAVPLASTTTQQLTAAGGRLYFDLRVGGWGPGSSGYEPWVSDGSLAGTRTLGDLAPGESSSDPEHFTAAAGQVFFTARQPLTGRELWVTDGTPINTRLVRDINPGGGGDPGPQELTAFGGLLYFHAWNPVTGGDLWRSDGTEAGTDVVRDVAPGLASGSEGMAVIAGSLVFSAWEPATGSELWVSDGTGIGTQMLADIVPGAGSSEPTGLARAAGRVLFSADEAGEEPRARAHLWQSNGTLPGTTRLATIHDGTYGSLPRGLGDIGGLLGFATWDALLAFIDPWVSDGTAAGTVVPFAPFLGPTRGGWLHAHDDGLTGVELWRSDGTASGLAPVRDIQPGPGGSEPRLLLRDGARTFFSADDGASGRELWVTDGTATGTTRVADICPGPCSSNPSYMVAHGGAFLLAAADPAAGFELWRTGGDAATTSRVADINPGPAHSGIGELTPSGAHVYFAANDGTTGRELWRSDGTGPGTTQVFDLEPDPAAAGPIELTVAGGKIFFRYYTSAIDEFVLGVTDGSGSGTSLLAPASPLALTGLGSMLLFASASCELWRSDGSDAGTVPVVDWSRVRFPEDDVSPCNFAEMVTAGGRAYFPGVGSATGIELWSTDGTDPGTLPVADIHPGDSSWPRELTVSGSRLFFSADDGRHGSELWALDLAPRRLVLRNDDLVALDPPAPPRATLLPLDPVRDAYADLAPGDTDPEVAVLLDATRPLVFYGLDGAATLHLVKTELGRVAVHY